MSRLDIATNKIIFTLIIAICLITTVFSIGALIISSRTDNNSKRISVVENTDYKRLRLQAIGLCLRLQKVRESVNNNSRALFVLSSEIAQSSKLAAKNPTVSRNKREQKFRLKVAEIYQDIADNTKHIDKTNCELAVDHPLTYKPPGPQSFTKKDLPKIEFR